jgi:multidrug efflux pump subunit AcrA (membrane-fusion protein)
MATELLTETESRPQPPRGQHRGDRRDPPRGRWWRRALIALGLVAVAAPGAVLIPRADSPRRTGPMLTHTIARGNVIVTVTEQGTLESSKNTEIKCKVRGQSTVIWVVESGTEVEPGDELVRLDTLALEDAISERTKYAHLVRSGAERQRANVARAKLAIPEYLEGRYRNQLMSLEKDLAIYESNLRTAENMKRHAEEMFKRGYVTELEVEEKEFAVRRAELNVEFKKQEIEVLKKYTKEMELETLRGNLRAAEARLEAEEERAKQDKERLDLAVQELEYCVIKAEKSGMVIHPSAAEWKGAPEIEEGATVRKDQVLLLMPDLSQMQVKVGIHESVVERLKPGMAATIMLPDKTLGGKVSYVSPVTRPAGWWTGNVVKYDTIVELPSVGGLKPGMSAEVEVIMDRRRNVPIIPASAVVETAEGDVCWVKTAEGVTRRSLRLGDTDDTFIVVQAGVKEGDEVVLNPLDSVEEAQNEALKPLDETEPGEPDFEGAGAESGQPADPETDHVD